MGLKTHVLFTRAVFLSYRSLPSWAAAASRLSLSIYRHPHHRHHNLLPAPATSTSSLTTPIESPLSLLFPLAPCLLVSNLSVVPVDTFIVPPSAQLQTVCLASLGSFVLAVFALFCAAPHPPHVYHQDVMITHCPAVLCLLSSLHFILGMQRALPSFFHAPPVFHLYI